MRGVEVRVRGERGGPAAPLGSLLSPRLSLVHRCVTVPGSIPGVFFWCSCGEEEATRPPLLKKGLLRVSGNAGARKEIRGDRGEQSQQRVVCLTVKLCGASSCVSHAAISVDISLRG